MRTILWMVVGTLLAFIGLSEISLQMARGYTNMNNQLWFEKTLVIFAFCGILVSPIPYWIGINCQKYFYTKTGLIISLLVGGWSLAIGVWAILCGGGLF